MPGCACILPGEYGDQILEMSWAVNETLNVLGELGIESNTMVAFISDHGPHREMCAEGGSSGPFRGKFVIIVNCETLIVRRLIA